MNISENSRVWIYQSDRPFTGGEQSFVEQSLSTFTQEWQAHGQKLAAGFEVRYNRFIILFVDEEIAGATGCSIDRSVNLMKAIEQELGVNLFDRFNIAYREGDEIKSCGREEFEQLGLSGKITEETIVFNNLIQTNTELAGNWEIPFKKSWHTRLFRLRQAV